MATNKKPISWINPSHLMLNKWADSLENKFKEKIFPELTPRDFDYKWNSLTWEERKAIYNKFSKIFKDKAVISQVSLFDGDSFRCQSSRLPKNYNITAEQLWWQRVSPNNQRKIYEKYTGAQPPVKFPLTLWYSRLSPVKQHYIYIKYHY